MDCVRVALDMVLLASCYYQGNEPVRFLKGWDQVPKDSAV